MRVMPSIVVSTVLLVAVPAAAAALQVAEEAAPEVETTGSAEDQQPATSDFTDVERYTTERWCSTYNTVCWSDRSYLSGVRFGFELAVTHAVQGGENRFEFDALQAQPKFIAEFNVVSGWIALQTGFVAPGTVELDEGSPLRAKFQEDPGDIDFSAAWTLGASFFDGAVSIGWGRVSYDLRGRPLVEGAELISSDKTDDFLYLSIQTLQNLLNSVSN